MTAYVTWTEDDSGDVLDVEVRCVLHARSFSDAWPCYGDELNPGEVAYCVECARPVAWSAERCGGVPA